MIRDVALGISAAVALSACGASGLLGHAAPSGNYDFRPAKKSGTLYVANGLDNSVSVFASGGQFIRKATEKIGLPVSLGLDTSGNVYVANYGPQRTAANVAIYNRRAVKLLSTITQAVAKPTQLAVDALGSLYVAMDRITEVYPNGSSSKSYRLAGAFRVAVDSHNNSYVARNGVVVVRAPGTKTVTRKIIVNGDISTLAVNESGELFVGLTNTTDWPCNSAVDVYDTASGTFLREITQDICSPSMVAFDAQENAYIANVESQGSYTRSVAEFAAGTTTLVRLITDGASDPYSIAMGPDGTLFVGNNLQSNVAIYAPGSESPKKVLTEDISGPTSVVVGP